VTLILLDREQTLLEIESSIHHTCLNGSAISSADAKVCSSLRYWQHTYRCAFSGCQRLT
jgi:hypothetical protein